MVVDDEAIYVSVNDAKVLKIVDGRVVSKASYSEKSKFFPDCGHFDTEPECGRPLGIRRLVAGKPKFVVCDAYLGVYIVDFTDEQNRMWNFWNFAQTNPRILHFQLLKFLDIVFYFKFSYQK